MVTVAWYSEDLKSDGSWTINQPSFKVLVCKPYDLVWFCDLNTENNKANSREFGSLLLFKKLNLLFEHYTGEELTAFPLKKKYPKKMLLNLRGALRQLRWNLHAQYAYCNQDFVLHALSICLSSTDLDTIWVASKASPALSVCLSYLQKMAYRWFHRL